MISNKHVDISKYISKQVPVAGVNALLTNSNPCCINCLLSGYNKGSYLYGCVKLRCLKC